MYSMIRAQTPSSFLVTQLPSLAGAFVVAELLYKFHSFTLECLAFLATWFIFDWAWTNILEAFQRNGD